MQHHPNAFRAWSRNREFVGEFRADTLLIAGQLTRIWRKTCSSEVLWVDSGTTISLGWSGRRQVPSRFQLRLCHSLQGFSIFRKLRDLWLDGPVAPACSQLLEASCFNISRPFFHFNRISTLFHLKAFAADRHGDCRHIEEAGAVEVSDEGEQGRYIQYVQGKSSYVANHLTYWLSRPI